MILAEGAPRVEVELSQARMRMSLPSELEIASLAAGDLTIEWRVRPRPEQHILLQRAAVRYQGSEEEWQADLARFTPARSRWELGWVVDDAIVQLVAAAV
jgi:hypothetical protein